MAGVDEHAVVVAGGGPTGLVLAAELALAGVDAVVVEPRTTQEVDGSRAGGLLSRTLEELDQRGVVDRFLVEGQTFPSHGFANLRFDISDLPTRHNHVLGLVQRHIERILAGWADELGVRVLRGREVVGLSQDEGGVDVQLGDGGAIRAGYLVGCDGGRSVVRKAAGIDFVGWDASTSWMIAEVELDGEPELGFRRDGNGTHAIGQREPGGPFGVVITEPDTSHVGPPDLEELRAAVVAVWGTDFGLRAATWTSRFTDAARQAATYRAGRVLVAGDAAHVHSPHGGQGLNTGAQDAVNLGWKLAQVVDGTSPDSLLDTYHAERHPVGARVLHNTMAQVALSGPGDRHEALRETMTGLLAMDEPRQHIAAMLLGLDIRYDLGTGDDGEVHPVVGRRLPDLDLVTADGPARAFTLLHAARPVLLDLRGVEAGTGFDASRWARVRSVEATAEGTWELPLVGEVPAQAAVLVRPDGYVAWAGDPADPALPQALDTWFGGA